MNRSNPRIMMYSGFSLVEVLVSIIILAVGMLGLAALQANIVKYNHSAQLRSLAVYQAQNIIDRMRANKAGVTSGLYNNASGIPSMPSCTNCSSSQIAQRDLHTWNSDNALLLPSGQGTVVGNGRVFTVTVRWDNERSGATGTACSGNTDVDLSCIIMGVQL